MIGREEILSVADEASLEPKVVEKDYVLGWLLAGIFGNPKLKTEWIFKGGTCLKKCYFETYRFSEDLDFTLKNEAHIDEEFLKECFSEISEWLYEEAGIEIPSDQFRFNVHPNPRDKLICEGRIYYKSYFLPEQQRINWPRIKLDLSADEIILNEPVESQVMHAYSDQPEGGFLIQSYAYEEVFGEKIRALADRKSPRDLYDVVNMYRHTEYLPSAGSIGKILQKNANSKTSHSQKCAPLKLRGNL